MITLDDFITKWTGKPVDFDGVYPNQCMDLMHQYVYDVLGLTDRADLAAALAYQVYTNYYAEPGHEFFDKIDNTPTGVPQKGDIVFLDHNINGVTGDAGHVCIFVSGDANNFKSFDSNYPTGSLPHIQDHTYTGVLGWLRYNGKTPAGDVYKGYDLTNKDSMKVAVDVLVRLQAGEFVDKSKYDLDIKSREDTIANQNTQIQKLTSEHSASQTEIGSLNSQLLTLAGQIETLQQQANDGGTAQTNLNQLQKDYNSDKIKWAAAEETYTRQIAQLKNSSFKEANNTKLIGEIVRRIFHINN